MVTAAPRTRARRPLTLLVAAFLALGGVGAAAGMALGAVGTASAGAHPGVAHHHDGPRPGGR